MWSRLLRFSLILILVAGCSYAVHLFALQYIFPEPPLELVQFSYKFNVGITLLFTSSIILASGQLKDQLGFIFLISGFIKLSLFIYLIKSSDFDLNRARFLHFFVPYVICLVIEILTVVRILNDSNFSKDN